MNSKFSEITIGILPTLSHEVNIFSVTFADRSGKIVAKVYYEGLVFQDVLNDQDALRCFMEANDAIRNIIIKKRLYNGVDTI